MTDDSLDARYRDQVARAALPEVLFVLDIALILGVKRSAARKAIRRGDCGPYLRLGRRLAVLRESLLEALREREVRPRQLRALPPGRRGEEGRS